MSLNIKNERTHALVRELAILRGVSQTEAVEDAVRSRIAELNDERDTSERLERILRIGDETSRIILDTGGPLSTDILYDEKGLPT